MPGRERIRYFTRDGGSKGAFTWDYPGVSGGPIVSSIDYCRDVTGIGDNDPFASDHTHVEGCVINKPFSGYFSAWFYNYVADVARSPVTGHLYTGAMSTGYAATRAAAETNPSQPMVDLSVNAGEIREIPSLMKDRGDRLIASVGNRYLRNTFGYTPLVRDITNLWNLTNSVDKKVQEIETLRRKGIRRTLSLGTWSASETIFRWVQTDGAFIGGNFNVETKEHVWAHTRWTAGADLNQFSTPEAIRSLASRVVLGVTVDLETVWNLMPWSWLFDWFFSMGDYLAANRNIIPASLDDLSVMRSASTTETWEGGTFADAYGVPIVITPFKGQRVSKMRARWFPDPFNIYLPFLDRGQVGILASLAASRLG